MTGLLTKLLNQLRELEKDLKTLSWDDYKRPRCRRRWWRIP